MNKRVIDVSCGDCFTVVIAEVEGDPMGTSDSLSATIQIPTEKITIEKPTDGDNLQLDSTIVENDLK